MLSTHVRLTAIDNRSRSLPLNNLPYLKRHIDTTHQRKKSFKCIVCDASFTAKPTLKRHIDSFHEKKKSF